MSEPNNNLPIAFCNSNNNDNNKSNNNNDMKNTRGLLYSFLQMRRTGKL